MDRVKQFFKKSWLYIVLLIVGVVVIVAIVMAVMPKKNAALVISIAPVDATVIIDGERYWNGAYGDMAPGHYSAIISKDGFAGKAIEFDLANDEITYLNEYIVQPKDKFDYYETDTESLLALREYASSHEDEQVEAFLKDYDRKLSIREMLPIEYDEESNDEYYKIYFRDDGMYGCEKIYCIEIKTSSGAYTDLAFSILRIHGYNPEDYQIIDTSDGCD